MRWFSPRAVLLCAVFVMLSVQRGMTDNGPTALNYFKNFFVTGNFVTNSVDFGSQSGGGGFVTGVINFPSAANPQEFVPPDADVVGAFLYFQTIVGSEPLSTTGCTPAAPNACMKFRGFDITPLVKEVSSQPLNATFSPCWSGGGGGTNTMKTFRADVRRLLPYVTQNGLPVGKALVNDADLIANDFPLTEVHLPDNGTGNQTPQTAGASLVVIYRLPTETLKSVVLYDGLQLKPTGATPTTTTQTLRGFYQATANPVAKLSLLNGSGAKNATEIVKFGPGATNDPIIATNPFFTRESNSAGSDRAWDGPVWSVGSSMPQTPVYGTTTINQLTRTYGEQVTVQVTHTSSTPYDCLATSAAVFSTEVPDLDFDGLLNVWETGDLSGTSSPNAPLIEPTGEPLPNLFKMGADPNVQDIFVEVGFMDYLTAAGYDTPLGHVNPHTHLPSQAVIDDIAQVFAGAALRKNPADLTQTKAGAIKIHFDVGNRYQSSPNVIKFKHDDLTTSCTGITDPECLARGGEQITETEICPVGGTCAFPGFRGVVGWKRGFQVLKQQQFDDIRRHIFRFVLFAHALGVPRDDDPTTPLINETKYPKSISGASDGGDGGGDFIITLGMWDNFTGTEFVQKSTFVHEFGHTAGLRHGGQASSASYVSSNCKSSYLSVMNYLFQIRGLIGPTGPLIDYSRQALKLVDPDSTETPPLNAKDLDEADLTETALKQGSGAASFPTRWYAPRSGSFLDTLVGTSASTRHCDGTPLQNNQFLADGVTPNPNYNPADTIAMVRVDGTYPIGAIDWNASGTLDASPQPSYPQDINFNGDGVGTTLLPAADGVFTGWNDWEHLDLRQTGARRIPGILSLEISVEDLSPTDPIVGDWGYGDWGYGDWGYGDWGYGDWGYGDWGYGDWGYGDDIDESQARSQGPAANTLSFTTTNKSIKISWLPPQSGGVVDTFHVWKALGAISSSNLPSDITPNGLNPATSCNATTKLCGYEDFAAQKGKLYQYFIVTWFASGQKTRSETLPASR